MQKIHHYEKRLFYLLGVIFSVAKRSFCGQKVADVTARPLFTHTFCRRLEEERIRREEEEEQRRIEEEMRQAEEARKAEEERLQRAIEAEEKRKREEAERLEAERKAVSENDASSSCSSVITNCWWRGGSHSGQSCAK